jgi:hypothetical protein
LLLLSLFRLQLSPPRPLRESFQSCVEAFTALLSSGRTAKQRRGYNTSQRDKAYATDEPKRQRRSPRRAKAAQRVAKTVLSAAPGDVDEGHN